MPDRLSICMCSMYQETYAVRCDALHVSICMRSMWDLRLKSSLVYIQWVMPFSTQRWCGKLKIRERASGRGRGTGSRWRKGRKGRGIERERGRERETERHTGVHE
jgi:hypothetical protein